MHTWQHGWSCTNILVEESKKLNGIQNNTISINLKHMHIKQDEFNNGMPVGGQVVEIRVVE